MPTTQDYISSALRELGLVDVTESAPDAALSNVALAIINRLLDEWNAARGAVYADVHPPLVSLAIGVNPHTIGLVANAPTWVVTGNRPVSIEGIRLTTDGGLTFLVPLYPRDAAWFHNLGAPGTLSDFPTDFYYDATWPNGSIFFYPTPSSSGVKADLWYRIVLAQVALSTDVSLPPGYQSAITETLKERLTQMPMFKSLASDDIKTAAREARANAFDNNAPVPALMTEDVGMSSGGVGVYDWHSGPLSLMGRS